MSETNPEAYKGHIYFEIQVNDPERAMAFYARAFGWKFNYITGLPIHYWRISTGGTAGGMLQRPAQTPPSECGTNAFVCSIEVKDYDIADSIIKAQGGKVALAKFAVPGTCWQGYYIDTEGNTFGIFQVDEEAG